MNQKHVVVLLLSITLLGFWPALASERGQIAGLLSCLPASTSFSGLVSLSGFETELPLSSMGLNGPVETNVRLAFLRQQKGLELILKFETDRDMVSNPFNLYQLLITQNGRIIHFEDFTVGCHSAGIGIYPNQKISLGHMEFSGDGTINVIVWGQL